MNYRVTLQIRLAVLLLLLLGAASAQSSYEAKLRNKYDTFAIFNRILHTLYPEVWQKTHELTLLDDFSYVYPRFVRFKIEAFCPPPESETKGKASIHGQMQPCSYYYPKQNPLMLGSFDLTPSGEITAFDAGYAEKEMRFYPFLERADSQNWSNERVQEELVAGQARFSADKRDDFLKLLKTQDFTPLIGKYKIKSIRFVYWFENHGRSYAYPGPVFQWVVEAETIRVGKRQTFLLFYEPFDGTLREMRIKGKERSQMNAP